MRNPIAYLCGIDDPNRIRVEAPSLGVRILSERQKAFIDSPPLTQFTVEVGGVRGFLAPTSASALKRQADSGRHLEPYFWVSQ